MITGQAHLATRSRWHSWISVTVLAVLTTTALAIGGSEVRDFSAKEAVLNFDLDGINLRTPAEDIDDILTDRGWQRFKSASPSATALIFVKGDFLQGSEPNINLFFSKPGGVGYRLTINKSDSYNSLMYERLQLRLLPVPGLPVPGIRGVPTVTPPPPPIPDGAQDRTYAAALKDIICRGIKDERKRWSLCPPNTEDDIRLADGFPVSFFMGEEGALAIQLSSTRSHATIDIHYND